MNTTLLSYLVFGAVVVLALIFDLGLISKKGKVITIKQALWQTVFWVALSLAFFGYLWVEKGNNIAVKYITAYLMEWSLSIDNIFVFLLIFSFFKVNEHATGRALLVGILLAIVFRVAFIALGVGLIDRFHWLLYIFGAFLVYTGFNLFRRKEDDEYDPGASPIYKWVTRTFKITDENPHGHYVVRHNGQRYFTSLMVVVVMLAGTDIVFALDSIPTVVSLVRTRADVPFTADEVLVIYSSNIFAVLGLRSLFFLLKGAVDKFKYLQQGIAIVLVFIGVKMLIEYFHIVIPIYASLGVIVLCLLGSILLSVYVASRNKPVEEKR
jgi:tellurite resistance protein TerC